uniref:Anoctamin n=1 Tax=Macrostomum lignano TaxID=282301 RepID=A0A1I8JNE6_9PLAT
LALEASRPVAEADKTVWKRGRDRRLPDAACSAPRPSSSVARRQMLNVPLLAMRSEAGVLRPAGELTGGSFISSHGRISAQPANQKPVICQTPVESRQMQPAFKKRLEAANYSQYLRRKYAAVLNNRHESLAEVLGAGRGFAFAAIFCSLPADILWTQLENTLHRLELPPVCHRWNTTCSTAIAHLLPTLEPPVKHRWNPTCSTAEPNLASNRWNPACLAHAGTMHVHFTVTRFNKDSTASDFVFVVGAAWLALPLATYWLAYCDRWPVQVLRDALSYECGRAMRNRRAKVG